MKFNNKNVSQNRKLDFKVKNTDQNTITHKFKLHKYPVSF